MNFGSFFKNKFKKNKNYNYSMATFGALVKTPKRDDYSDEVSNLKIDEFKDDFHNILLHDITLTSNHLHDDNIQNELNMNLDLLMKVSFDTDSDIITQEEKRARNLIIYAKLELYLKRIVELENEIKFRIIALDELYKDLLRFVKIRYIINRRSCIKEEINNLLGILCILMNQKYAIYNKVNACTLEYKTFAVNDNDSGEIKTKYFDTKYRKLMGYASTLLTDKEINDVNNYNEIVNKIAVLERYFEIYTYVNGKDIDNLREKLKEYTSLLKDIKLELEHGSKTKQFNPYDLKILEIIFRVFDEFGSNIVSMEDLYNLYKLKFDYTVIDIYENHDNPLFLGIDDERRDFTEYAIYGQIVMEMIEDLVTNKWLKLKKQFDIKGEDFWLKFNAMLNPSSSTITDSVYDANDVLAHNLSLAFLLAAYNFDLDNFFHKYKIDTPDYMKKFMEDVFHTNDSDIHNNIQFEDRIPLETFIITFNALQKMNFVKPGLPRPKNLADYETLEYFQKYILITLADLYPLILDDAKEYVRDRQYGRYYVPHGVTSLLRVQRHEYELVVPAQGVIIDALLHPGRRKDIYTPQSLREINTSALDNIEMNGLVLNEGLERFIIDKESEPIKTKKLVISSTVRFEEYDDVIKYAWDLPKSKDAKKKELFGFNAYWLKEIHFTNFRNSIMLKDRDFMKEILFKYIQGETRDSLENKYFFKCDLWRIVIWEYGYNTIRYLFSITGNDIEQIIKKMARSHYGIYVKAVKNDYAKSLMADLVLEKILSMIYDETGVMLCSDTNTKKLVKKR